MPDQTITPPPGPHELLANAVLHLANAVTRDDGIMNAARHAGAARDLVRDLAFPRHVEKIRPTPAPSCDAPHCGCATGEDCHANGAADVQDGYDTLGNATTTERNGGLPTLRAEQSDHRVTEGFADPHAASNREVRTAVMALQRALGVGEDGIVGPATMRSIEDISTADASEAIMVRMVAPLEVRQTDHGDYSQRWTWTLDPEPAGHRGPFFKGDLVAQTGSWGGVHQIVEVRAGHVEGNRLRLVVKRVDVVVDPDAF